MNIPETRQVARISNHGSAGMATVPLRKPGPGEMVISVACSLISPGTEMHFMRQPRTDLEETWYEFGYQNAGIVVDPNDCPGFEAGDRVACMGINYAQHTDWCVVPHNLTVKLSDAVSFEEGAFAGLLGTAVNAVRRAELQFGEYVAVAGLGIVGQLIAQISTRSGAHVIAFDRVEMRQKLALQLGAETVTAFDSANVEDWKQKYTRGHGLDAGIIAFGGDASTALTDMAVAMKKSPDSHSCGRAVVVGAITATLSLPAAFGNMDIRCSSRTGPGYHDKAWERGRDYADALVPWHTRRNLEECFLAIEASKLQVKPLITHCVTPDEIPSICRHIVDHPDETLAVIVNFKG